MNPTARITEIRARWSAAVRALRSLDRSARMPRLLDAPSQAGDPAACMRAQRVVVVGLGSVGLAISDLLSRASVAWLLLVDRAQIKPESVLTHPVQPCDIGCDKATLAGQRAKAVSPNTRVQVFSGPVAELPPDAFVGASAVFLSSDNLACELEVSQRCLQLGLPLIQASVHGPTLVAQVRSLANAAGGDGPCLACGYQASDWEALDRGTVFSCTGGPARWNGIPTVSPAHLCSLAASLAVTELLGRSAGLVPASESRLIEYCGFQHRTVVTPLLRRAECQRDHGRWQVVPWARRLATATPRELLAAAGCTDPQALAQVSLTVPGFRFRGLGMCACTRHPVIERFQRIGAESAPCTDCGSPLDFHPLYTHAQVPGIALRAQLDRSLGQLGADAADAVLVRRHDEVFLFHARKLPVPANSR